MLALLITVLAIVVVCGAFALLIRYSPLPEPFKGIGVWVCLVIAVIWLLYVLFAGWRVPIHLHA